MKREDYLLRMIAQTAQILAHIRRLLAEGKHAEAGEELERASRQGGIDLGLVIGLDEASVRPLLLTGGEFDRPKCALFAEVVYLEWLRARALGRIDRAERCARRALLLYALAYEGIVTDDQTRRQIAELQGLAEPGEQPNDGADP
jgi:hypothetical protein